MARNRTFQFVSSVLFIFILTVSSALSAEIPVMQGIDGRQLIGTPAIVFSATDLSGKAVSLTDLLGKGPILLFFYSIFSPPSTSEFSFVNGLVSEYGPKGLIVLGVNTDGSQYGTMVRENLTPSGSGQVRSNPNNSISLKGEYSQFAAQRLFPVVYDELKNEYFILADPYKVTGTPTFILINHRGTIIEHITGSKHDACISAIGNALNRAPQATDSPNYCSQCGTQLSGNPNFCPKCGRRIQ